MAIMGNDNQRLRFSINAESRRRLRGSVRSLLVAGRGLSICASVLLGLGLGSGCLFGNDECKGGSRCDGTEIQYCEHPCAEPGCSARWAKQVDCVTACVEPHGGDPMCALSSKPDDGCKGPHYCRGKVVVECTGEYATSESDCAPERTCVTMDSGDAFCALSDQPDPRCPQSSASPGKWIYVCDGTTLVSCRQGFAVTTKACAIACASPSDEVAFCAGSSDPDPHCAGDPPPPLHFCVQGIVAECESGYAAEVEDCTAKQLSCGIVPATGTGACF